MKFHHLLFTLLALSAVLGGPKTSWSVDRAPAPAAPAQEQPAVSFARDVVPFLAKHCYHCHGNGKKRGELSLDRFHDEQDVQKDRKVWENVLQMLQSGEMPPKERPRPTAAEMTAVLRSIDAVIAKLDKTRPVNVLVRRGDWANYLLIRPSR